MEKIWQKNYPKGIPHEISDIEERTLVDLYTTSCKSYSDKTSFSCMGSSLTFSELFNLSTKFASYLQNDLKLEQGMRIAIMLPNLLQYPIVMFGALQAGLTIVNINPMEKANALKHELSDSGTNTIVVLENFAAELDKIIGQTKIENVIVTGVGDFLGFPRNHIVNFVLRHVKHAVPKYKISNTIKLTDIIKNHLTKELTENTNNLAFIQYTSGTTANAKGVMLSHKNILANIYQAKAWLGESLEHGNEIIITALPLYHIFSLTANCFVFSSIGGNNILIPNPRDINSFVKQITAVKFTAITGVNTLFHGLLQHPKFKNVDFKSFKTTLGGGMAVSAKVAEEWHNVTNCYITQAYGLTETSPAATINKLRTPFNNSIGYPIPSTNICIKDSNDKVLDVNEHGEICIQGPQVTDGYWNNEIATKEAIKKEWFHTGDIGYINKDGLVFIVDRLKDLIVVSGFNVQAIEVESCITELDEVAEAAVVAIKDEHQGEAIAAHIVLNKGLTLEKHAIISYCHNKIAAYKVPHHIFFHDELPKNNLGKILKRHLRDMQHNYNKGEQ
jgi:long-chain acyl-CoA synthetase